MNSKVKGIVICAVAAVCLGAMLLVLKFIPKADNNSSSNTSVVDSDENESKISLTDSVAKDLDKTNVKSVELHNPNGEFKIVQTSVGGEEWEIKELSGINQNQNIYTSVATTLCSLAAKDVVEENADDLSKYGLERVVSYFTVTFHYDGKDTQKVFLIGDKSPESGYYYVCEAGSTKVYTVSVSSLSYFFYAKEDFISLAMLSQMPSDADENYFTSLKVTQKSKDYDIVFKSAPDDTTAMVSAQVMTSPIFSYLDVTNSSAVTHGMWGLTAQRAVVAKPTEADFEKYGLKSPNAVADLKCKDGEYILKVGNCEYVKDSDGENTETIDGYYVYLEGVEGIDVIFYCTADNIPWASFDPSDVISGLMTTNNIVTLKDVKVKTSDIDITYDIAVSEKDDEGNQDIEKVLENSKEVDAEVWKGWYQLLIQCPTTEIYFTEPEGKTADITIDIDLLDGGKDTMEFYKQTDRRYIVKLNGKTSFRIESGWIDAIIGGIEKVRNGEEVDANTY